MSHYDDIYDEVDCPVCGKTVDKYPDATFINSFRIERSPRLKPYEDKYICVKCMKELK
jgi:DNA-directed RNA polymerase subunit RPC12/RpoP